MRITYSDAEKKMIAKRLIAARGSMSQQEVAEKIGITRAAYSNYEKGARVPEDVIKKKIANIFNCSILDLFY